MNIVDIMCAAEDMEHRAMGSLPKDEWTKVYESKDGKHQIGLRADIIEPGWEWFEPTVDVFLDGQAVYQRESKSVGSYHNTDYHLGIVSSLDAAGAYLQQKVGNLEFTVSDKELKLVSDDSVLKDTFVSDSVQLQRVAFYDEGVVKNGTASYHKVTFVEALDKKTMDDKPVPNPYLRNDRKMNGTQHAVYLNDTLYNNLMSVAKMTPVSACIGEAGPWEKYPNGVVNAVVVNGRIGLTQSAIDNGKLTKPDEGFSPKAHNNFLFISRVVTGKSKGTKRPLPDVPYDELSNQVESDVSFDID